MYDYIFLIDFNFGNPRIFVIGKPPATDLNISLQDDKEFVFVSTPFKDGFIQSIVTYLNQLIIYFRVLLVKPIRLKRSKSVLLKEYEKLKAQW